MEMTDSRFCPGRVYLRFTVMAAALRRYLTAGGTA